MLNAEARDAGWVVLAYQRWGGERRGERGEAEIVAGADLRGYCNNFS